MELFNKPNEEVRVAFETFAKSIFEKGLQGLLEEFNSELKGYTGVNETVSRRTFEQNMNKNRYKDIPCRETHRVVLNDKKGHEYIHANMIKGDPLQTCFIATPGPTSATVADFWRMVEHCQVQAIVMLCDFMEMGKKKCEVYFPRTAGETMTAGNLKITCVSVTAIDQHFERTQLKISSGDEKGREVRHYRFTSWPDQFIPKSGKAVLRLLTYVRSKEHNPLVHCSAGIGRTGSFVSLVEKSRDRFRLLWRCVYNNC